MKGVVGVSSEGSDTVISAASAQIISHRLGHRRGQAGDAAIRAHAGCGEDQQSAQSQHALERSLAGVDVLDAGQWDG